MKYGKKILAYKSVELNGNICEVYCLDGGKYYDIHTISERYQDDELNTLRLQEPKESVSLEQVTNDIFLTTQALEFLLWDAFYGYQGKLNTFTIDFEQVDL